MPSLLIQDVNYTNTLGVYSAHQRVLIRLKLLDINNKTMNVRLEKVYFNEYTRKVEIVSVKNYGQISIEGEAEEEILLPKDITSGLYLLSFINKNGLRTSMKLVVHNKKSNAAVGIINPTFTEWSYHYFGFYHNEHSGVVNKVISRIESMGDIFFKCGSVARKAINLLGIKGINQPQNFPAHTVINLKQPYMQNHKWNRSFWDKELSQIDGLWSDDILSTFPLYALLDKNKIRYHVYSDLDMHNQNSALLDYDVLIFYGQEGITKEYYDFLDRLMNVYKKKIILCGPQGFGYREFEYCNDTFDLKYICTRGEYGLWGERLEENTPAWRDEGRLLGFHFPEPKTKSWRKYYRQLTILLKEHWLIKESGICEDSFEYYIYTKKERKNGLTWAGGEIYQICSAQANVIACLAQDEDIIGIGEKDNLLIFAPTYWPAYFAYQYEQHPEVERLLTTAINHFLYG